MIARATQVAATLMVMLSEDMLLGVLLFNNGLLFADERWIRFCGRASALVSGPLLIGPIAMPFVM